MSEGEPQVSTKERLTAFKADWFKKHPQNLEILDNFQPVIDSFVKHLTPEIGHIETDLNKMIVIWSTDTNSPGYLDSAAEKKAMPEVLYQTNLNIPKKQDLAVKVYL